uniref:Ig-like domain-containing protein n=1 Tax=Gouania willdenowi TaxID=441366 RepID=A0A8C5GE44_GOUWI
QFKLIGFFFICIILLFISTSKQITGISNSEFFFLSGFTEINVCCVYGSNCTLSCSFRQETDDLYWYYITRTGQVNVHSFYKNRDQLDHQDPSFNGRTSLVEDQVTGRKTALMLKKVKVQDEGKYKCFVKEVFSPVQTVDMVTSGNSITCSSEGIYPKPELTWSSSPQSSNTMFTSGRKHEHLYMRVFEDAVFIFNGIPTGKITVPIENQEIQDGTIHISILDILS